MSDKLWEHQTDETPTEMWARLLDDAETADDCSPSDVAAITGDIDGETARMLWGDVVGLVVQDGRSEMTVADFQQAWRGRFVPSDDGGDDHEAAADGGPDEMPAEPDQRDDVSELSRDDLEAEVEQLRAEVDKLQEVANRDVALIRGALVNYFGVDDLSELPAAADAAGGADE